MLTLKQRYKYIYILETTTVHYVSVHPICLNGQIGLVWNGGRLNVTKKCIWADCHSALNSRKPLMRLADATWAPTLVCFAHRRHTIQPTARGSVSAASSPHFYCAPEPLESQSLQQFSVCEDDPFYLAQARHTHSATLLKKKQKKKTLRHKMTMKRQRHTAATRFLPSLYISPSFSDWLSAALEMAQLYENSGACSASGRDSPWHSQVLHYSREILKSLIYMLPVWNLHGAPWEKATEGKSWVSLFMWRKRWLNPEQQSSLESFLFSLSKILNLVVLFSLSCQSTGQQSLE